MGSFGGAAFVGGFASMLAQTVVLRELLSASAGNDLVVGVALGSWLLLTGIGSYATGMLRLKSGRGLEYSLFASAVIMPLSVLIIRMASPMMAAPGETAPLQAVILMCLVSAAPYCLVYGAVFSYACSVLARDGRGVGRGYSLDSLGSALGGIVFAVAVAGRLDSFQAAALSSVAALAATAWLSPRMRLPSLLLAASMILAVSSSDFSMLAAAAQYPGGTLLLREDTRYGAVAVTEAAGELTFWENGAPLFTSGSTAFAEEAVHYALPQRPGAQRVLLIGGGASGAVREALKYGVAKVDYVELDPELIELVRKYVNGSGLDDPRVNVIADDGRHYLKNTLLRYDVLVVGTADPTTLQMNRYHTREFYLEAKRALTVGGVVQASLSSSGSYMGSPARSLNAAEYATLKSVFANVLPLPVGRNVYLASDSGLSPDVGALIESAGVETAYVNKYYLSGILTPDRLAELKSDVTLGGRINSDGNPNSSYAYLRYWLTLIGLGDAPLAVLVLSAAILIVVAFRLRAHDFTVVAAGFAGTAAEVTILMSFQAVFGYVYSAYSLIVAAYMLGLYVGPAVGSRWGLKTAVSASAIYPLALAVLLSYASSLPAALAPVAYFAWCLIAGALAGAAVSEASKHQGSSGLTLSLDFLGAAAGGMVTGALLIPAFGIINACVAAAFLYTLAAAKLR